MNLQRLGTFSRVDVPDSRGEEGINDMKHLKSELLILVKSLENGSYEL